MPKTTVKIYNLWNEGKHAEAMKLHHLAALAEQSTKAGIAAVKYAASIYTAPRAGLEKVGDLMKPRRPYEEVTEAVKGKIREAYDPVWAIEQTL